MESLSGLTAFVCAAELGSFVAAAERLGVSASAIGKSVARLEQSLGVRLLNRSTRHLSLSEEGAIFFARSRRIVEEIELAEAEISRWRAAPRGRLRISLPAIGYRMLLPVLPEFRRRYPDIDLDLDCNDRLIDVIAEGVDAVIRSGEFQDSRLQQRKLGYFRFVLVASPGYLRASGNPQTPEDLSRHACLRYRFPNSGQRQQWEFIAGTPAPSLSGGVTFNNVEALIAAAQAGLGIAYVPDFAVAGLLADGSLCPLLSDYLSAGGQFSLLWPANRHLLPKLRVFVDFLAQQPILNNRP